MSEQDRVRWDQRHADREPPDKADVDLPAAFRPYADVFPRAGNALDVACGRGTGAVWLALRGMTVHGVDVSPVAVRAARDLAGRCGVAARCRFDAMDLDAGLPPEGSSMCCCAACSATDGWTWLWSRGLRPAAFSRSVR